MATVGTGVFQEPWITNEERQSRRRSIETISSTAGLAPV